MTLTIDEVQLPTEIAQGAVGGPIFSTIVGAGSSATEKRRAQWVLGRRKWDLPADRRTAAQADELVSFFYCRRGRLYGFRLQDPEDYTAANELLYPTGSRYVQLEKTYTSGSISSRRPIYKPSLTVPVTMTRNGSPFSSFTLDVNSGAAFLTPDSTKTITAITQANPAVITANAHGFLVGDRIWIESVVGMTQINLTVVQITAVTTNTFTVNTNTTGFSAYVSGGVAKKFVQPTETLLWSGEFDYPARFDVDECNLVQVDDDVRDWDFPVIELMGTPAITVQSPP